MAGPLLYSTNPWFSVELIERYRKGVYYAWVCECFDTDKAPADTAIAKIAASSNPAEIYRRLRADIKSKDEHSLLISSYRKTFGRLARKWLAATEITKAEHDEILASVRARSWTIWEPVLYVIPRGPIEVAGRLESVVRKERAAYGPEQRVIDLKRHEFDILELGW